MRSNNRKESNFALGLRVKVATLGLAATMTAASLQGCSPVKVEDQIKVTASEDSYKQFGVSPETLKGIKDIQKLSEKPQGEVGNDKLLEYFPSQNPDGTIELGNEGKIARIWLAEITEKIANAINRTWRQKNGIELNGEGEENAPKYVEPSDIRIEKKTDPDNNNAVYYVIYVNNEPLLSSKKGSKNGISKDIVDDLDKYFTLLETDVLYQDMIRSKIFKAIIEYFEEMSEGLGHEYEYTKGQLKIGGRSANYPFGRNEDNEREE